MYRFVSVYKAHGKWNRQLSRFRCKMVVNDYLWILSMYSHCNYSHSNLFILCNMLGMSWDRDANAEGKRLGLHVALDLGSAV
jgi:hypothetical protein